MLGLFEITEEYMKDRLYEFRGKKVILDSDLAEIYVIIPELSEPPVRTLGATIPENESHIFR